MTESVGFPPLTWAEILDTCSRLYTTRTKKTPWGEDREGSQMIDATVDGRPVQIVPTRMHEPGLYWRWMDVPLGEGTMRSDEDIDKLRDYADQGLVSHGRK